MFIDAASSRSRRSTGSSSSRASSARRPTTSTSGRSCSSTAATSSATRPRRSAGRAGARSSTSTTTTTTRCSGPSTTSLPEASCTAEIVWDLMHGLGVKPTLNIAEALYVGLITDTGRFMYENTGPRAHEMAADLIEARRRRARDLPPRVRGRPVRQARAARPRPREGPPLRRRAADRDRARRAADFAASGAEESYSEGVIDHLRSVEGTAVAALIRERTGNADGGRAAQGVAARQRRARRRVGDRAGPGRRRPSPGRRLLDRRWSGTSWSRSCAGSRPAALEVTADAASTASSCTTSRPASPRMMWSRGCGARSAVGVKVGHAGTLDPFATGLLLILSAAPPACSGS